MTDAQIGAALRIEYQRQLAQFKDACPRWAHLENPSWDFGSTTVRAIIDGKS